MRGFSTKPRKAASHCALTAPSTTCRAMPRHAMRCNAVRCGAITRATANRSGERTAKKEVR